LTTSGMTSSFSSSISRIHAVFTGPTAQIVSSRRSPGAQPSNHLADRAAKMKPNPERRHGGKKSQGADQGIQSPAEHGGRDASTSDGTERGPSLLLDRARVHGRLRGGNLLPDLAPMPGHECGVSPA
jgi:hypothetical protein